MSKRSLIVIALVFVGLFVVFFGISIAALAMGSDELSESDEAIGVVEITGPIMDSKKTIKRLRKFAKHDGIKAIVVRIDSPGGSVAPSQEMYDAVRWAKGKKPLVVSMGSTAASGGYYIACGADTIFANPGSVTGSIGVITQLFNVERLLDRARVEVNTVTTGPYKDSGSPFAPFTERDKAYFDQLLDDIYAQFVEDVAEGRKMKIERVRELADGRVYTGRQAKALGLVDELGSMQDAITYVAKQAGVEEEDPKVVYPPEEKNFLGDLIGGGVDSAVQSVRAHTSPQIEYRMAGF